MINALLALRERSESFSNAERGVAQRILENPKLVVDLSVHELARETFSSPSTIVRLCNHTGFGGYKEFRKAVSYPPSCGCVITQALAGTRSSARR